MLRSAQGAWERDYYAHICFRQGRRRQHIAAGHGRRQQLLPRVQRRIQILRGLRQGVKNHIFSNCRWRRRHRGTVEGGAASSCCRASSAAHKSSVACTTTSCRNGLRQGRCHDFELRAASSCCRTSSAAYKSSVACSHARKLPRTDDISGDGAVKWVINWGGLWSSLRQPIDVLQRHSCGQRQLPRIQRRVQPRSGVHEVTALTGWLSVPGSSRRVGGRGAGGASAALGVVEELLQKVPGGVRHCIRDTPDDVQQWMM